MTNRPEIYCVCFSLLLPSSTDVDVKRSAFRTTLIRTAMGRSLIITETGHSANEATNGLTGCFSCELVVSKLGIQRTYVARTKLEELRVYALYVSIGAHIN